MDPQQVARELLRALRGRRSQVAFSRRLGYRTNVVYTWESGRRWPTAAELFRAARVLRGAPEAPLAEFFGARPAWLDEVDLATPRGVHHLVGELCGSITRVALAARIGCSRHAVGRWLTGRALPRVPELLAIAHHATGRLPDFVACFTDPETLPSVAPTWRTLEQRRTLVWRLPWAPAVLRALELDAYRALPAHRPGWIAERLGLPAEIEAACLGALEQAEAIRWTGTHYAIGAPLVVDTRRSPGGGRELQAHWARVGLDRIERGRPGLFAYNVMSVSTATLEALQQLHRAHYARVRDLVAASDRSDRVLVLNLQLFELS